MNVHKSFFEKLRGKKAYLNESDYKIYHKLFLGSLPSDAEIHLVFRGRDFITQREADQIVDKKLNNVQFYILEIFRCFDVDCKGYIDLTDFKCAWTNAASNLSWEVLKNSFADVAPQAMIDYESFKHLYFLSNDCLPG